ncbi:MAG TPA: hemerythrin domain-containing protein [Thermoanaerobaculia bacterium]|nr:hemerythrin domain-containing protein [Thermoanaerobaculia bacterium]
MQIETGTPTSTDPAGRAWAKEPLTAVVKFILETHHVVTRKAIDALPPLAARVRARHGELHPETRSVEGLVRRLVEDLGPHMLKEERILFPYIEALEAPGRGADACFPTVQNPIRVMLREHEAVEEILGELRAVTANYALPTDACESYHALYAGLEELEADLKRHIRIENDVLFPGAIALEAAG